MHIIMILEEEDWMTSFHSVHTCHGNFVDILVVGRIASEENRKFISEIEMFWLVSFRGDEVVFYWHFIIFEMLVLQFYL